MSSSKSLLIMEKSIYDLERTVKDKDEIINKIKYYKCISIIILNSFTLVNVYMNRKIMLKNIEFIYIIIHDTFLEYYYSIDNKIQEKCCLILDKMMYKEHITRSFNNSINNIYKNIHLRLIYANANANVDTFIKEFITTCFRNTTNYIDTITLLVNRINSTFTTTSSNLNIYVNMNIMNITNMIGVFNHTLKTKMDDVHYIISNITGICFNNMYKFSVFFIKNIVFSYTIVILVYLINILN